MFLTPVWLPDGRSVIALGHRFPAHAGSRFDVWLLAADGSDATPDGGRNLSARYDLMPGSAVLSDVTVIAEALFAVLRSLGRPVRFMRVPAETHELTRSGTPFRRSENLIQVRDWFSHFLVKGRRGLPPLPKERAGK